MTFVFTFASAGLLGKLFARRRSDYLRLLLTVTVLMLLLGLNVSVLGLVDFGGSSIAPVVAFFALIVLLDGVFVVAFVCLRWKHSVGGAGASTGNAARPSHDHTST